MLFHGSQRDLHDHSYSSLFHHVCQESTHTVHWQIPSWQSTTKPSCTHCSLGMHTYTLTHPIITACSMHSNIESLSYYSWSSVGVELPVKTRWKNTHLKQNTAFISAVEGVDLTSCDRIIRPAPAEWNWAATGMNLFNFFSTELESLTQKQGHTTSRNWCTCVHKQWKCGLKVLKAISFQLLFKIFVTLHILLLLYIIIFIIKIHWQAWGLTDKLKTEQPLKVTSFFS